MLAKLVSEIVQSNPDGLKHVEVVEAVLRSGYRHQGKQPLSVAVYETLKSLVVSGAISRIQDDLMERRYKTIGAITFNDCPDDKSLNRRLLTKSYV